MFLFQFVNLNSSTFYIAFFLGRWALSSTFICICCLFFKIICIYYWCFHRLHLARLFHFSCAMFSMFITVGGNTYADTNSFPHVSMANSILMLTACYCGVCLLCLCVFCRFAGRPGDYNKLFNRWRMEEVGEIRWVVMSPFTLGYYCLSASSNTNIPPQLHNYRENLIKMVIIQCGLPHNNCGCL